MNQDARSPISEPPRRQAGQTLRQRLAVERDGFIFYFGGAIIMAATLLVATWSCWFLSRSWTPWVVTASGGGLLAALAVDARARLRRGESDQKGLLGELTTAEWLDDLVRNGYTVFHDLQGVRWNIDHAAVGPAGVLVIETKYRAKRPGAKIRYDGRRLLVGDHDATDRLLGQARACRDEVARRLRAHSPQAGAMPVRAVLAFPGWEVQEASGSEVWVLNPKNRIAAWARQEANWEGHVDPDAMRAAVAALDAWSRGTGQMKDPAQGGA